MKASKLVEKLNMLIGSHGDVDIFLAGEMGWDEIDQVEIEIATREPVPWNAGDTYPNDPARNPRKEPLAPGTKFIGIV